MKNYLSQVELKDGLSYLKQLKDSSDFNLGINAKNNRTFLTYDYKDTRINYYVNSVNEYNNNFTTSLELMESIASNSESDKLYLNYNNDKHILNVQEKDNNNLISDYFINCSDPLDIDTDAVMSSNRDIELKANEFINALKSIKKAVAANGSIPIIQCYNFLIKDNKLTLTTIDGFRLMQAFINCKSNKEFEFNLKGQDITTLTRTFTRLINKTAKKDRDNLTLNIKVYNDCVKFFKGPLSIEIRIVEGKFIEFNDIFPNKKTTEITLNKNDLLKAINKSIKFVNPGNNSLVKFTIEKDYFSIESKTDKGNVQTELKNIKTAGNPLTIAFNATYIKDMIEALDTPEITLEFTTPVSPVDVKTDNKRMLILPVRLAQGY